MSFTITVNLKNVIFFLLKSSHISPEMKTMDFSKMGLKFRWHLIVIVFYIWSMAEKKNPFYDHHKHGFLFFSSYYQKSPYLAKW